MSFNKKQNIFGWLIRTSFANLLYHPSEILFVLLTNLEKGSKN